MANVAVLNEAGELLSYRRSVHTPDYLNPDGTPVDNVIINPPENVLGALPRFVRPQPPVVPMGMNPQSREIFAYLKANGVDLGPAGEDF